MIINGALINGITIIVCSVLGIIFKNKLPKKILNNIMIGMGLCILYIGITGVLKGKNVLVLIASMIIGSIIGEILDMDKKLQQFGYFLEFKINKNKNENSFSKGFINSTLLFCVGAMAIVGSLQGGLSGNNTTLYAKSFIDGAIAITMASTLGVGVLFSSIIVLIYESTLTISASLISPYLSLKVIDEITCVGSLLIIVIALNMLKITKIKVTNFSLSPFIPIIIYFFIKT